MGERMEIALIRLPNDIKPHEFTNCFEFRDAHLRDFSYLAWTNSGTEAQAAADAAGRRLSRKVADVICCRNTPEPASRSGDPSFPKLDGYFLRGSRCRATRTGGVVTLLLLCSPKPVISASENGPISHGR